MSRLAAVRTIPLPRKKSGMADRWQNWRRKNVLQKPAVAGEEREPVDGRSEPVGESQTGKPPAISLKTLRLYMLEPARRTSAMRSGGTTERLSTRARRSGIGCAPRDQTDSLSSDVMATMASGDSSSKKLLILVVMNSDTVAGDMERA
jgi:hypothetical protein